MVTTVLEAKVAPERVAELKSTFEKAGAQLPPPIVETTLLQDAQDPSVLRIVTVWRSRQELDEMRQQPEKPKGVQMFESVGATPKLTLWETVARAAR